MRALLARLLDSSHNPPPHPLPRTPSPANPYPATPTHTPPPHTHRQAWDMRALLARLLDGSRFEEFKSNYGKTLITGKRMTPWLGTGQCRGFEGETKTHHRRRRHHHHPRRRHLHRRRDRCYRHYFPRSTPCTLLIPWSLTPPHQNPPPTQPPTHKHKHYPCPRIWLPVRHASRCDSQRWRAVQRGGPQGHSLH